MSIKPLDDRVLVKQTEAETKTAGGIVLPDSAQEKPQRGKVISTGPGKMLEDGNRAKCSVKKGDEIIYSKYGGNEVEEGKKAYVILRESDILAIVD